MLKFILCKLLNWHNCEMTGYDGTNIIGECKRCGAKCLRDSQNNWFKIEETKSDRILSIIRSILFIIILVSLILYFCSI